MPSFAAAPERTSKLRSYVGSKFRSFRVSLYPTPAHARLLFALLVAVSSWSCRSNSTNSDSLHSDSLHSDSLSSRTITSTATVSEASPGAETPTASPPDVTLRLAHAKEPGSEAWGAPALLSALGEEHVTLIAVEHEAVAALEALAGGHVDAAIATNADVLVNRSLNQPCAVLTPVWVSNAERLFAETSLTTIADLRGKTIGVELGRPEHAWLEQQLEAFGLGRTEVQVKNVIPALATQALAKGGFAAVALTHPESAQIRTGKSARQLTTKRTEPLLYGVLCVAPRSLRDQASSWRTVVRLWNTQRRRDGEAARQEPRSLASFESVPRRTLLEATSRLDAFFVEHAVYTRRSLDLADFPE